MYKSLIVSFVLLFPLTLFAKINVTVSILPQKYFVHQIAGDLADIEVMVLPGSEPASYEPKPKQLTNLLKSKIYFTIGVPYERVWLPRFKKVNPNIIFSDTSEGIKKYPMSASYDFLKNGGNIQISAPKSLDPHIWLSPLLVGQIAKNIAETLIKVDTANADIYRENLQQFLKKVDALHRYGINKLGSIKRGEFIVFHPVWGYFAREFHLKQIPIQIEGKRAKPSTLAKLIKYALKHQIKVIFVQPEFSKKSAEVIAENIGAKIISLDPLSENWEECIKKAIDIFSEALSEKGRG